MTMTRGYIVPIGGAEEKISDALILRRFVDICGGAEGRIVVIPTASRLEETADRYEALFTELGIGNVCSLRFEERSDCFREDWLDQLDRATGVFMTGGNQLRLSTTIGGTPVADKIREGNAKGLHVAGTSAGASIMAEHMIAYGDEGATPRADMVTLVPGLGLIAFGVALFIWPELLRYLVAGTFVLAGLGLMLAARKIGRMRRKMSSFQSTFTGFGGPGGPGGRPRSAGYRASL